MGHATSIKRESTVSIDNMARVYREAYKKNPDTAETVLREMFIPTFANNRKHLKQEQYERVLIHKQRKIAQRIDMLFPKVKAKVSA